jgi:polar amino acid transport system substrate-binding protein
MNWGNAVQISAGILFFACTLSGTLAVDPGVSDLVQAGKIRTALFLPQYTNDPVTGELRAASMGIVGKEIAGALAARLGIEVQMVGYPTPPAVVECLKTKMCDIAFLGIEASRTTQVDFSNPVVLFDYTFLVSSPSKINNVAEVDRPGVRIAVVRGHASTVALSRIVKHAELVNADVPTAAFELLRTGQADAFARARDELLNYSDKLPGSRVLDGTYGVNRVAIAIPKGKAGWLTSINEVVEETKASGLVQRTIDHAGLRGFRAAPPGNATGQ